MTPLTAHFTIDELVHSQVAARLGITNEPSTEIRANLLALCVDVLEPLRNVLGRPIFVSSGYRSPALNRAVNGSKLSDHMLGLAADIIVPPMPLEHIVDDVRKLAPFIPLKQCILEFPEPNGWVHVSRRSLDAAYDAAFVPQFLLASVDQHGSTVYTLWPA